MEPISTSTIALFVAKTVATYGFNKGLEKIFKDKKNFIHHLHENVYKTIENYQEKYPINDKEGKFAFYKSDIIITEFLKYRIFGSSGYQLNESNIQIALKQNPNIIIPTDDDVKKFTSIFDELVREDSVLRKLEVEAFYKEEIFEIRPILNRLENRIDSFSIDSLGKLEDEYRAEIVTFKKDLKNLKAKIALENLESLEERIQESSTEVSSTIWANLYHLKASCLELTGKIKDAWQYHIRAYKKLPGSIKYVDRACFSYFNLKDEKYKVLIQVLNEDDEYNPVLWAIQTYQSKDVLDFLENNVPKIAKENPRFKRLVFNHYLSKSTFDIVELLHVLEFNKLYYDLPEKINNENFYYAVSLLNAVSTIFFRHNKVPFWGFTKRNDESLRYLNLSRLLSKAILRGEVDSNLNAIVFYSYWIESEIDCKEDTILNLEKSYQKLNNKEAFRTVLYATSLFKHKELDKTKDFLDSYVGEYDENLYSFKSYVELSRLNSANGVLQYLSGLEIVDEFNIHNVCNFIMVILSNNLTSTPEVEKRIGQLKFENENYKGLVILLLETFSSDKEKVSFDRIKALKYSLGGDSSVSFYVAQILYENGFFKECTEYIKPYIKEDEETRELGLYIYALNAQKTDKQVELLRVLKIWRDKYSFNEDFLKIELELRQILKDWEEIYHITKFGYKHLPENEYIFTTLILAVAWGDKSLEIEKYIPKIKTFKFESTESVLRIVSVLLEHQYFEDALDLLYGKAQNKSDILARQNYFFISSMIPKKYYKSYKKVKKGRYVKLEIGDEKRNYFIDDKAINNQPIISESLGKKVGDNYSVPVGINKRLVNVRVISVMNRHMSLSDEIMEDASSPFSAMEMEQVKFESLDKKGIDEALIKNFGGHQLAQKKHSDENLNKYYRYKISFSELVSANFDESYFDGYLSLTSNAKNGFLVRPLKSYPQQNLGSNNRYVIDFSSGLLLFELAEKFNLKYERFIISSSLLQLIDNLIRKTELGKNSKLSVSIEDSKVIPHFIPKDFHKKRIKRLTEIREWFVANSEVVIPEEKLGVMRQLNEENGLSKVSFEYLIDNAFLAQRENHILVSDDFIYSKHLKVVENTCSSEMFLKKYFSNRQNELMSFMIEYRYVGLSLNEDILYDCYTEQHKEGKNHIFKYALRNLSLKSDSLVENTEITVLFIKKLALSPFINPEKYKIDITNTLVALMLSMNKVSQVLYLKAVIYKEFRFTGEYLDITLNCLLDAMKVLNITDKI